MVATNLKVPYLDTICDYFKLVNKYCHELVVHKISITFKHNYVLFSTGLHIGVFLGTIFSKQCKTISKQSAWNETI